MYMYNYMYVFLNYFTFRDHGREMPFAEKSGYTPDVNIEYVDTLGRLLTPKEVCVYLFGLI